jgi:hypothetical protein
MPQTVMATRRPGVRKLSHIPEMVVEHFAAQSKSVTLNAGSPDATAVYGALGRFPVEVGDLNEDLVAELKRERFQFAPDGTIRRGDCLLYVVDNEIRDALRDDAEIAWRDQEVKQGDGAAMHLDASLRRATGGAAGVEQVSGGRLRDHIQRGR